MSGKDKTCFVIMPFSSTKSHSEEYWTRHFEFFLLPLIESVEGVIAHRSEPLRGNIAHKIILDLINSDIVVADITDHNPNVFWEFGVRQSFKHGTITIAERGTKLPFDISLKGCLFYNYDHLNNEKFNESFTAAINDIIIHPEKPDSQVIEAIGGRGTLYELVNRNVIRRRLEALIDEINWNKTSIEDLYQQIRKNQKDPVNAVIPTDVLRCVSLDLLLSDRYLDVNISLYDSAGSLKNRIHAINEHVVMWADHSDDVEEYLLKMEPIVEEDIVDIETELIPIKENYGL